MSAMIALALAAAQVFSAPLDLPKTARVEMVVSKTREDVRGGKTTRVTSETRYDKTIETRPQGYRVTLKPTSVKLPSTPETAKVEAAMGDLMNRPVVYVADEGLKPSTVEDWPGFVAEMRKSMLALAGDDKDVAKAMTSVVVMFEGLSPEQAAGILLKEEGLISLPINVELEAGKPFTYEEMIASPMGGSPIKSNGALAVQKVETGRGVAVLRWTQTLDPGSMRASLALTMQKLMAGMGPEADRPEVKAMLAKMTFDRTSACDYEIDLKSGLPVKTDCEVKITLTDPATGETGARNEYWAITQTLKN